jgi:hypothetical protein
MSMQQDSKNHHGMNKREEGLYLKNKVDTFREATSRLIPASW